MKARNKLSQAIDTLYAHGPAPAVAYKRLLLECIRTRDVQQANRLHSHMQLHAFQPPDSYLHNRLLYLYSKSSNISLARQLFDDMPHRDLLSWNSLLSAYSNSGSIHRLLSLFNRMPYRDSVSYNTVIAALVNHASADDALRTFLQMLQERLEPSEYTYVSVLNACSQLLDSKRGKQIHCRIIACRLIANVFVWNSLIDMYAKCGAIDEARKAFDRMSVRNVVSWNTMISGFLRNRLPHECIDIFVQMQALGVKPDLVTLSGVVGAYCQCGLMEEAGRVFREMKEKDSVCWTSMIAGYAQNGREEDALVLFVDMLKNGVRPDCFTMSSIVNVCAGLASLDHGMGVHGQVVVFGIEGDLLVSSALIDMYSKCGEIKGAWDVFCRMEVRNLVSWNAMIMGFVQNGLDKDALVLYERMLEENLKPDNITFVGVLSACSHACLVEDGWKYFRSMTELHSLTPTTDHYACMIYLLGRSGNVLAAVDLVRGMPHEPNSLIWSTLLAVCRITGDIKHGEIAAGHLFELDRLDAGPYIMLSNMYAASGRWNDVASIRSLMKDRNIRKSAAYSWIDINTKLHKFVSDDRSHPESERIYDELHKVMKRLREGGFVHDTTFALHNVEEKDKINSISFHSEKLALAFGLINKPQGMPIRIMKNVRVCGDCHLFMKLVSKVTNRLIILRDSNRFHHFTMGQCSCQDYW